MTKPQLPNSTCYDLTFRLHPDLVYTLQSIEHDSDIDMLNIVQANALENLVQDINDIYKEYSIDIALEEVRTQIESIDTPSPMTPHINTLEELPRSILSKIINASYRCKSRIMTLHTGKDIRIENLVHYEIRLLDLGVLNAIEETLSAVYPIHHLNTDTHCMKSFAYDVSLDHDDNPYMISFKFSCYKKQYKNIDI